MAVKLILVVLLVAVMSSGLAQQSSSSRRTGGGDREDRRLALRRFQNRNRSNSQDDEVQDTRRQQPRRLANQDKIAERRRELLQRNGVTRRRKVVRTQENEIEAVEPTKKPENVRIRITPAPTKVEDPIVLVEKIGNSDNDIIDAVLDRDEEAAKKPFIGTSEVRTISSPNSIRTGNEQIVRISFKKTTSTTPAPVEEEEEEQVTPFRRRFPANRGSFRKGSLGRRLGRPSTKAPTTTTPIPTTTKVFLLSQANDALKALLKTANEPVETTDLLTNTVEDERPLEPAEVESAVLEMEEDNGKVTPVPTTRSRGRGDRRRVRVNVRGRGRGQQRTNGDNQEAPRQSVPSRDRFRSFPARQSSGRSNLVNNDPRTRSRIVTPRTTTPKIQTVASTEQTRFETRPTVSPVTATTTTTPAKSLNSFKVFDDFEGFTFPAPIRNPPTTETTQVVTELPRSVPVQSQFSLQQSFVAAQPQPQVIQQAKPAPAQTFVPAPTLAPQRQPQPAFIQQQQPPVPQVQQQPQRVQPFVAFNNQQFQTITQAPAVQTQSRFQPATSAPSVPVPAQQPQFLNNGNFNLLNPSNFQAFDAQFGGSVPTNPASSQVSSNIFTQPGTSLLQGRDVLVNPFSAQSNGQQPSVFGTQNLFGQPAASNNFQTFRSG